MRVDYDLTRIPAAYDRGRDHGPEVLNLWMSVIESQVDGGSISMILDLGCGTGRFSEGLATRFRARVVGVDPSEKMLDQARRKRQGNGIHWLKTNSSAASQLFANTATGRVDSLLSNQSMYSSFDSEVTRAV